MSPRPTKELSPTRLPFAASAAVAKRLAEIGRTEDLRLSPDGQTLAITAFNHPAVLLLQIKLQESPKGFQIAAERGAFLTCSAFGYPHGLAWLDARTLLVANRASGLVALEVPLLDDAVSQHALAPSYGCARVRSES